MRKLTIFAPAILLAACAAIPEGGGHSVHSDHWGEKPRTRFAEGNTLVSSQLPDALITLPKAVNYIGSTRFDLKEVADAEIHLFVEVDKAGEFERAYWIQFESYLPRYPSASYDFTDGGMPLASLGQMELYYRARFGRADDAPPEESEAFRVRRMIKNAGYSLPSETYSAQFHQVVSADNRSEILVIVIGDLSDVDLSFEQIVAGGREGRPLQLLSERVLPIAQRTVSITFSSRDR